MSAKSVMLKI